MDIWLWPLTIVIILICAVGAMSMKTMDRKMIPDRTGEDQIPEEIAEHPFRLNPIFIIIGIATLFIAFVIFYYAFTY